MTNSLSFIYSYNLPTVFFKTTWHFFLFSWKCPKADPLCCQILLRVSPGLLIDSPPAHNVPTELISICENLKKLEPVRIFFMPALIPFNGLPPTSSWSLKAISHILGASNSPLYTLPLNNYHMSSPRKAFTFLSSRPAIA